MIVSLLKKRFQFCFPMDQQLIQKREGKIFGFRPFTKNEYAALAWSACVEHYFSKGEMMIASHEFKDRTGISPTHLKYLVKKNILTKEKIYKYVKNGTYYTLYRLDPNFMTKIKDLMSLNYYKVSSLARYNHRT